MTVLTASPKSVIDQKKESSAATVRLNITGVDVKGQMFRHPATVLNLDKRDCVFLSESQPELDGSVLAEFNYEGASPQSRVTQARVKSNLADLQGGYKVVVELELAQTAKVNIAPAEARPAIQKPAAPLTPKIVEASVQKTLEVPVQKAVELPARKTIELPVPSAIKVSVDTKPAAFPIPPPAPWDFPVAAKVEESVPPQPVVKEMEIFPPPSDQRSSMPKVSPANTEAIEESIKSAVASEIRREMSVLKNSISLEIEKALPALISSKMEKMIREDVEKQVQSQYESSTRSLHEDVTSQVQARLADSTELHAMLQNFAKKLFEENAAQFQGASIRAEEEISSHASALMRSFEESIAAMEKRMNVSRTEMESAAAEMRKMKQEINEGMLLVQNALQQVRDAERPGIEQMQDHAAAQLKEWSAQFDNLLNKSATEKAIQFSLDMERRMAPHRQRADESVEKLGAMLQLLQGTARVQQERLNEQSIAAAANFEKQIKAFLVRLGEPHNT